MGAPVSTATAAAPTHWLILDFEATCDGGVKIDPQEIIEFPVVAIDAHTHEMVAQFRTFVRPLHNPQLTPFCTELTGIQQHQVDGAPGLPQAVAAFHDWMVQHGFSGPQAQSPASVLPPMPVPVPATAATQGHGTAGGSSSSSPSCTAAVSEASTSGRQAAEAAAPRRHPLFVTCGDWDVKHMHKEAELRGIVLPSYWHSFCNIKFPFSDAMDAVDAAAAATSKGHGTARQAKRSGKGGRRRPSHRAPDMMGMLAWLKLPHEGRHHSGLDDALNIGRIAAKLAGSGISILETGRIDEYGKFTQVHRM